jgi:1-acyl-sn-glycerol-3-phosphate acyltransferase
MGAVTASTTPNRPYPWLLRWARLVAGFLTVVLVALPMFLLMFLVLPSRLWRIRVGKLYGNIVGWTVARIAGATPVFSDKAALRPEPPAIYVSNHTSTLDIFLGMWLCPMDGCGIAKREITRVPVFGALYWLSGHLLIDRANRESAIAALAATAEIVRKHGLSVWMWPEGTRSADGRLQPFKKGFAHLALATGLPIKPVVVHGAHAVWPSRSTVLAPGRVQIDVLPLIPTVGWSVETLDAHIATVHAAMEAALARGPAPMGAGAAG